jgi:hypothetical protein
MYKVRAKIIKGSAGMLILLRPIALLAAGYRQDNIYWRSVAVERLQQVSKVSLIVEPRLL